RQGKPLQLKATIAVRPDQQQMASNVPDKDGMAPSSATVAGLGLSSLTPEAKRNFNIGEKVINGAVITKVDPDSEAAGKGLQPGDVVLRIGNKAVHTPADFQAGVAEAKKGAAAACFCWWPTPRVARASSPSISTRHDLSGARNDLPRAHLISQRMIG